MGRLKKPEDGTIEKSACDESIELNEVKIFFSFQFIIFYLDLNSWTPYIAFECLNQLKISSNQ